MYVDSALVNDVLLLSQESGLMAAVHSLQCLFLQLDAPECIKYVTPHFKVLHSGEF